MCLNCGCGQLDTRHKETDLVREDVRKAADGQGSSMEATIGNLERSLSEMRTDTSGRRQEATAAGRGSGAATR